MTRRARIGWTIAAALFTTVNVAGAVMAGAMGEELHTLAHVALAFVGAWLFKRLYANRATQVGSPLGTQAIAPPGDDRLGRLEQSVDAVAIEVERVGESQRFMNRLMVEKRAAEEASDAQSPKPSPPGSPPNGQRE